MTIFVWDGWAFDPAEWRLTSAGNGVVPLPNKTLDLLALLLDRAPGLVSKDDILSTVWRGSVVEEGNIAFHVAMLRKTLDASGGASCIETVRGRGYRFAAPVARRLGEPARPAVEPVPPAAAVVLPPAPDVAPDGAAAPGPRDRRAMERLWPAALLALAVAGLGWASMSRLDARVPHVTVLPARSVDGAVIDGVAGTVASQLARQTTIPSRVGAWRSADESALDAGRRLKAEAVLTATVDRSRDPWRVAVQLTRTHDARPLWNWMFDVPASAPATGGLIGARLASGLGRHFDAVVPGRAPSGASAEALRLVVQARESWRLRTPPSVQQAIALYERAIVLDPASAPAYAGLADCYNLTMSGLPTDVRYAVAKANAERALALDPGLAEAHTSLAFALYKFEWNWSGAEAAFRRAIASDPDYALARHWYGEMLGYLGRYEEAIAELRQAEALDPNALAIKIDLVGPLLRSGRVAEARAVVEAGAGIDPTYHAIPGRMADVLAAEGRERESLEEEWRMQILRGAALESVEELRAAYRAGGLAAVLRVEIARLETGVTERFAVQHQATFLASRYARLGDRDKALHWIGVALDRREDIALLLPTYREFDALRGDPEFDRMLERVGLKTAGRAGL
jgi:DNA-binding winged helix-turn-helix (wHTH) protein